MVLGYSSGKDAHRQLIGGVLRTGKRESHCVNYYSMLGDLSQNMGDYGRILNVLNCVLPNNMSWTCGSVFTNLCRQPSFNGFERHHCTKIDSALLPDKGLCTNRAFRKHDVIATFGASDVRLRLLLTQIQTAPLSRCYCGSASVHLSLRGYPHEVASH